MECQRFNIDQVQLIMKSIILKPGKQIKGDKKVSVIHDMVPEDKKTQARKALRTFYPRMPRRNYLEDTVVCDQQNCR